MRSNRRTFKTFLLEASVDVKQCQQGVDKLFTQLDYYINNLHPNLRKNAGFLKPIRSWLFTITVSEIDITPFGFVPKINEEVKKFAIKLMSCSKDNLKSFEEKQEELRLFLAKTTDFKKPENIKDFQISILGKKGYQQFGIYVALVWMYYKEKGNVENLIQKLYKTYKLVNDKGEVIYGKNKKSTSGSGATVPTQSIIELDNESKQMIFAEIKDIIDKYVELKDKNALTILYYSKEVLTKNYDALLNSVIPTRKQIDDLTENIIEDINKHLLMEQIIIEFAKLGFSVQKFLQTIGKNLQNISGKMKEWKQDILNKYPVKDKDAFATDWARFMTLYLALLSQSDSVYVSKIDKYFENYIVKKFKIREKYKNVITEFKKQIQEDGGKRGALFLLKVGMTVLGLYGVYYLIGQLGNEAEKLINHFINEGETYKIDPLKWGEIVFDLEGNFGIKKYTPFIESQYMDYIPAFTDELTGNLSKHVGVAYKLALLDMKVDEKTKKKVYVAKALDSSELRGANKKMYDLDFRTSDPARWDGFWRNQLDREYKNCALKAKFGDQEIELKTLRDYLSFRETLYKITLKEFKHAVYFRGSRVTKATYADKKKTQIANIAQNLASRIKDVEQVIYRKFFKLKLLLWMDFVFSGSIFNKSKTSPKWRPRAKEDLVTTITWKGQDWGVAIVNSASPIFANASQIIKHKGEDVIILPEDVVVDSVEKLHLLLEAKKSPDVVLWDILLLNSEKEAFSVKVEQMVEKDPLYGSGIFVQTTAKEYSNRVTSDETYKNIASDQVDPSNVENNFVELLNSLSDKTS